MCDVFSTLDALPIERGDLDNAVGKLGHLPTLIAVVGSSGKSIASCALSSILSGQGKGVGLFLHCLPSDADRVYVNGKLVCESEIEDAYKELRKPIAKCRLSKEQALYLIALHIFASKGLDYGVVEFDVGGYSSSCYADSLRYEARPNPRSPSTASPPPPRPRRLSPMSWVSWCSRRWRNTSGRTR